MGLPPLAQGRRWSSQRRPRAASFTGTEYFIDGGSVAVA
jgi:hypothetical protein